MNDEIAQKFEVDRMHRYGLSDGRSEAYYDFYRGLCSFLVQHPNCTANEVPEWATQKMTAQYGARFIHE